MAKNRQSVKSRPSYFRAVTRKNIENGEVTEYPTIKAAAIDSGVGQGSVNSCATGTTKLCCKKYEFRYKGDPPFRRKLTKRMESDSTSKSQS